MDLKELRYFRAIAESGTFSKAAALLRVAQPALSRQMRKLEHDLGVELLRRSSRGVTPTAAGEALLRRTIFLESEMESARREVSRFAEQVIGTLRISTTHPLSTVMVPNLVREYRKRFPNVALQLVDGYSGDIADDLLQERLDVAITTPPSHNHVDLTTFPLWTSDFRLVCPPPGAYPEDFAGRDVTLTDIARLPVIMANAASALRQLVNHAFARQHLRFEPVIEANGPHMILAMVEAGLGFSLFPHTTFAPLEEAGRVTSAAIRPAIRRTMSVLTRTSLLKELPVAHFVAMAKAAAAQLTLTERFRSVALYPDEFADIDVTGALELSDAP